MRSFVRGYVGGVWRHRGTRGGAGANSRLEQHDAARQHGRSGAEHGWEKRGADSGNEWRSSERTERGQHAGCDDCRLGSRWHNCRRAPAGEWYGDRRRRIPRWDEHGCCW
jgi:hypothetical protein